MYKKILPLFCAAVLFGTGCQQTARTIPDENIPIDNTPIQAGTGQSVYQVCKDETSGERIYFWQSCGIDTCANQYYDRSGSLIEEASEGMVPEASKPKIKVKDCVRTTKEYFESKIQDKGTLPKG